MQTASYLFLVLFFLSPRFSLISFDFCINIYWLLAYNLTEMSNALFPHNLVALTHQLIARFKLFSFPLFCVSTFGLYPTFVVRQQQQQQQQRIIWIIVARSVSEHRYLWLCRVCPVRKKSIEAERRKKWRKYITPFRMMVRNSWICLVIIFGSRWVLCELKRNILPLHHWIHSIICCFNGQINIGTLWTGPDGKAHVDCQSKCIPV